MKTIEEKAKAYDEALERAQKATRAGSDVAMDIVQYIFPELAKSEEKPMEGLEEEIQNQIYNHFFDLHGIAITGTTAYASVEDMEYIARHFAQWGAEHLKRED